MLVPGETEVKFVNFGQLLIINRKMTNTLQRIQFGLSSTKIKKVLKIKAFPFLILAFVILVMSGCERTFEYSPYSASVNDKRKNTTQKKLDLLAQIEEETAGDSSFKIALISDSHTFYNSLAKAVNLINQDEDVDFVLHGGDMTDGGLIAEYTLFFEIVGQLNQPYFTVIGNHDLLANGRTIYGKQYGSENYSFVFKRCKFVFFNDVIWELNYTEPDFGWLTEQIKDSDSYDRVFVIAHIPPWSDQFTPLYTLFYSTVMDSFNVDMSIHGHHHDPYFGNFFQDDVPYLVIGSPGEGVFRTLIVKPDTLIVETIQL